MLSDQTIQIIYASTSGNVEVVAETVSQLLQTVGIKSSLSRAERTNSSIVKDNQLFIFATSTWEHGRINPFFDNLLSEMEAMDFKGKKAAFFGCGDTRYEPVHFNEGIEIVRRLFVKNGGEQIGDTLKIDGEPYKLLDSTVKEWGTSIADEFQNL